MAEGGKGAQNSSSDDKTSGPQTPEVTMKNLVDATTNLARVVDGCFTGIERLGERLATLEGESAGEGSHTVRRALWQSEKESMWKVDSSKGNQQAGSNHKKDFKITGQIVIKAIPPSSHLRSYLEGQDQLSLEIVEQVVRAHCSQETATDLYRQLSLANQGVGESPTEFLMRGMSLRDRVVAASKEEDGLYDAKLVQAMFLRSVQTGLRDNNIRMEMKPHLVANSNSSDVLLLEKMSRAIVDQKERDEKLASTSSPQQVHVNKITVTSPRCNQCTQQGMELCRHCFRCGGNNHIARWCRTPNKNQGNASGAPQGDEGSS
ncbi:hypothetical protein Bbelb_433810 [Branchiostoma belcheri]|nr:hypothetical protein Bbelb_433810 [Branchiostoma belcheri]